MKYKAAYKIANIILKENSIIAPPISIFEIIDNMDMDCIPIEFKNKLNNKVMGFVNPVTNAIYFNSNCDIIPGKINFTLAYELGMLLLHKKEIIKNNNIAFLQKFPLGKESLNEMQKEAICFAIDLLIPEDMFSNIRKKYPQADTESLSKIFGVTEEMIRFRIKNK